MNEINILTEQRKQGIGKRIMLRRERLGYSQEELADELGISKNSLGYLERGKRECKYGILLTLKKSLFVSAEWLLEGDVPGSQEIIAKLQTLPLEEQKIVIAEISNYLDDVIKKLKISI